jgi:hypothetical protein
VKTFKNTAAQGEIGIRRIAKLPSDVTPMKTATGRHIIGHSETGHHHVLERPAKVFEAKAATAGMRILYAIIEDANVLTHDRPFDTHEPIALDPGIYEFRIGREYDPYEAIARRQAD